ncbi:hypothetical protein NP493_317g00016 [Ridgeia piscesae]|uniref:Uncharacterized protein n=1 Tax=Ridgeia piscesae TaxID=27915 RepID=A0AAD9NVZ3_RIDPI|nr:hypothetical protein NP493_317g00016 [Ridgeia piscesae]
MKVVKGRSSVLGNYLESKENVEILLDQLRSVFARDVVDTIDGVAEIAAENWADTEAVVRKSFTTALKLPEAQANAIRIERAHRTGSSSTGRPKTIVVRFESYKDRDCILQAARKEKPRGIFVNEDLSHCVMERRKQLLPKLREARSNGKIAYLVYDRLVVKDRADRS